MPTKGKSEGRKRTDVGYKRPPKEHQFKKGQRGGPGRRKGSVSLVAELRKELEAHPEDRHAIIRNFIDRAKDKDPKALAAIAQMFDRIDGKPDQHVQADVSGEVVIRLEVE